MRSDGVGGGGRLRASASASAVGAIGMIPLVRAAAAADGVVRRGGARPIASCIAEVRSRVTSVPHCTSARWAAVPVSWQSAKSTWTERASVRPLPGAPRELARPLEGPGDRVGRVVDRHAGRLEEHVGVEPAVEQQLRGIVPAAGERGQQVRGGRLLPALLRRDLRQSAGARRAPCSRVGRALSIVPLAIARRSAGRAKKRQDRASAPPLPRSRRAAYN